MSRKRGEPPQIRLSAQQKRILAILDYAKDPMDVTSEKALAAFGVSGNREGRKMLLRAVHALGRRGLVRIEREPDPRGGWGRVMVTASEGAANTTLTAADLQRARDRYGRDE